MAELEAVRRGGIGKQLGVEGRPRHRFPRLGVRAGAGEDYDGGGGQNTHAGGVCPIGPPDFCPRETGAGRFISMRKERRKRRASSITLALSYQLDVCCKDGKIQAMVVA